MYELVYILMMMFGGGLFALGGWGVNPPVWWQTKAWRRFALPIIYMLLMWWMTYYKPIQPWQFIGSGLVMVGVLHLGYGEKHPWIVPWKDGKFKYSKLMVGFSYVLPALFYGWTWWLLITPVVFMVLFALSNWGKTCQDFVWKVCEFLIGVFIMTTILGAIERGW